MGKPQRHLKQRNKALLTDDNNKNDTREMQTMTKKCHVIEIKAIDEEEISLPKLLEFSYCYRLQKGQYLQH